MVQPSKGDAGAQRCGATRERNAWGAIVTGPAADGSHKTVLEAQARSVKRRT